MAIDAAHQVPPSGFDPAVVDIGEAVAAERLNLTLLGHSAFGRGIALPDSFRTLPRYDPKVGAGWKTRYSRFARPMMPMF